MEKEKLLIAEVCQKCIFLLDVDPVVGRTFMKCKRLLCCFVARKFNIFCVFDR